MIFLLAISACTVTIDLGDQRSVTTTVQMGITLTPSEIQSYISASTVPTMTSESPRMIQTIAKLIHQGPGRVAVPILLYHHVLQGQKTDSYSVSKPNFIRQMDYLIKNGYRTIGMDDLVNAIQFGEDLPEKSVIITFDDGNENVYLNAYPVMKERGLIGILLIIANRIGASGFLTVKELLEMKDAGWEIGSHGMRHVDLVKETQDLRDEIGNSKKQIEADLGMKISIFAFPYGKANSVTMDWVKRIGYKAALGLGISNVHDQSNLFYLARREVKEQFNLVEFAKLLESG